jgi:Fe-S-cluster containining protein
MSTDRIPLPIVRLDATAGATSPSVTAEIGLTIGGEPVRLQITVPTGSVGPLELLPVFRGVTEVVVGIGVRKVEAEGRAISCQKGCGACCRQLVPVSETEARLLTQLVEAMPEPRRSEVRSRFAQAVRRLDEADLLRRLRDPAPIPPSELRSIGLEYFALGVPCPFLEDEACSIHPDRPLACREYLVTSPAEECARPTADTVRRVPLPARVAGAARAVDRDPAAGGAGWVALTLAPEWAAAHPEPPASRPGPDLLMEFFKHLAGDVPNGT